MTAGSDVTIDLYWRPGCGFCSMLRRGLAKRGIDTVDHNIWDSAADADIVRQHSRGNETVPTVVIAGIGLVNPTVGQVEALVAEHAPHLLPPDDQRKSSLLDRLRGG